MLHSMEKYKKVSGMGKCVLGISGDRTIIILVWFSKNLRPGRGEGDQGHLLEKPDAEFTPSSGLTANPMHLAGRSRKAGHEPMPGCTETWIRKCSLNRNA